MSKNWHYSLQLGLAAALCATLWGAPGFNQRIIIACSVAIGCAAFALFVVLLRPSTPGTTNCTEHRIISWLPSFTACTVFVVAVTAGLARVYKLHKPAMATWWRNDHRKVFHVSDVHGSNPDLRYCDKHVGRGVTELDRLGCGEDVSCAQRNAAKRRAEKLVQCINNVRTERQRAKSRQQNFERTRDITTEYFKKYRQYQRECHMRQRSADSENDLQLETRCKQTTAELEQLKKSIHVFQPQWVNEDPDHETLD
jgi:hypothetical protein